MSIYRNTRFTPCDFISEYSEDVWDRLRTVQATAGTQQQIRYDETTVTQEMVYLFNRLTTGGNVHLFERDDERNSGADLDLRIVSNSSNYGFHAYIQSKRVYNPNQTYDALFREHGRVQLDRLINYQIQNNTGALPLYLFYNYHSDRNCNRNPKDFGLTIAPAISIKNRFGRVNAGELVGWNDNPSFELFHITNQNFCRPFTTLFCPKLSLFPYMGLSFPFNIPFLIFEVIGLRGIFRDIRINDLLQLNDFSVILKRIVDGNYGVVDSLMFKKELIEKGVPIKIPEVTDNLLDSLLKFNMETKSDWLKGYSRYGVFNKDLLESMYPEEEKIDSFEARYKVVIVLD